MFKVRKKGTDEIITVLDTYCDELYGITFFFIFENGGWRWRPANNYVPPNWEGDKK